MNMCFVYFVASLTSGLLFIPIKNVIFGANKLKSFEAVVLR